VTYPASKSDTNQYPTCRKRPGGLIIGSGEKEGARWCRWSSKPESSFFDSSMWRRLRDKSLFLFASGDFSRGFLFFTNCRNRAVLAVELLPEL
jgi:hypothetical protein